MSTDSLLPSLLPAIIALVVISVAAGFGLAWIKDGAARQLVRRAWMVLSVLIVLGVAIFWFSGAMVPGRASVDRSLQEQQQRELDQRTQSGGH